MHNVMRLWGGFWQVGNCIFHFIVMGHRIVADCVFQKKTLNISGPCILPRPVTLSSTWEFYPPFTGNWATFVSALTNRLHWEWCSLTSDSRHKSWYGFWLNPSLGICGTQPLCHEKAHNMWMCSFQWPQLQIEMTGTINLQAYKWKNFQMILDTSLNAPRYCWMKEGQAGPVEHCPNYRSVNKMNVVASSHCFKIVY